MKAKLTAIGVLLVAYLFQATPGKASASSLPLDQLKPMLEPCLEAVLAPLETYPAMPRIKVETLRADFAGSLVTASTQAEKEVYRNAMAVCDAMTSDMDARAKAQARAKASADMATLSTGGDVDESMPMHGRGAGRAGRAIANKQKSDRGDADQRAEAQSNFVNSSAYTSWVNNAQNLREQVMNLYTRQAELEAVYKKSAPVSAPEEVSASSPKEATGKWIDPSTFVGTWSTKNVKLWLSPDNVATRIGSDNGYKRLAGTWSVDGNGHFRAKFANFTMKGDFSDDGKSLKTLNKAVYRFQEE